jgi:SAM-dependent methyltransferase
LKHTRGTLSIARVRELRERTQAMTNQSQYSDSVLRNMQSAYGKGFLSPGGAAEVADIVADLALEGCAVLDLGCGVGGAAFLLAEQHGASSVLGVDIEAVSIGQAVEEAASRGLADRVRFQTVEPGPLPLPSDAFDAVFNKDVICHVPDKAALFAEIFRVLKPGGVLAFGDFLKGLDGDASQDFEAWATCIGSTGLRFKFEPEPAYRGGLAAAGFVAVEIRDHNPWSAEAARRQLEHLTGPGGETVRAAVGGAGFEVRLAQTRARLRALESRGLLHCHVRARKPQPAERVG